MNRARLLNTQVSRSLSRSYKHFTFYFAEV
nr:MAG TPA_asm: hypothetical protein [Caudoviricetes sp.]